jgi:modulator of FtsH protease
MPTYEELGFGGGATLTRDQTRTIFGQVMGLVAVTCCFAALGAYLMRNSNGASWFLFFIGALACVFGLNFAASRGREQLSVALLFGMGLLLGMAMSQVIAYYAKTEPAAVYQATACTAGFIGGLGAYGYATRRDLSGWARSLFWALLALIAFGVLTIFVTIPNGNIIYCVLGLVIFGGFTIVDFNRLRRTRDPRMAVPLAAGIFLDIFNVFLLFLSLFGGGGRR